MEDRKHNLTRDAFLDAAATEALGAHTLEESDAFVQTLALADADEKQLAREFRETTARLAAASPYMEPPAELRSKIITATAPVNFKMDDYRRKGDIAPRWLRWGMVAAVLFLVWSAYTNMNLRTQVEQITAQRNDAANRLKQYHEAIAQLVDPQVKQATLVGANNLPIGKLLINEKDNSFLLVMPDTVIPQNKLAKIIIEQNGKPREIVATAVGALPDQHTTLAGKIDAPLNNGAPIKVNIGDVHTSGMLPE